MRGIIVILAVLILRVCSLAAPDGYKLTWSEEFDAFDAGKWSVFQEGERHDAFNTLDCVSVKEGILKITPERLEGKQLSGALWTADAYKVRRGYVETRVKFKGAKGVWSDIWLYTPDMCGPFKPNGEMGSEIDIFEHRAEDEYSLDLSSKIVHTVHYNGYDAEHLCVAADADIQDGFNIIGVELTDESIRFYVNGRLTFETKEGISKLPLSIVISTEIKDDFWAGKIDEFGINQTTLEVDYIRVYEK